MLNFILLGNGAEKYKNSFKSPNVQVIGGLKYLQEALQNYRLFVCPMTYGAGMKGKIGGAVAAGVPVVTTSIGAEGFPFTNGEECFIADSPEEFAERCNQCLTDPALWHRLSVKSRLKIAENFSPGVIAEDLKRYCPTDTGSFRYMLRSKKCEGFFFIFIFGRQRGYIPKYAVAIISERHFIGI